MTPAKEVPGYTFFRQAPESQLVSERHVPCALPNWQRVLPTQYLLQQWFMRIRADADFTIGAHTRIIPNPSYNASPGETFLNDATTTAAASGISTGPVPSKPEKRRRCVRFEDKVAEQAKPPDQKTKTANSPIQRPKIRHAKPSEMQITTSEKVFREKAGMEYYTPGLLLGFESSDDEDGEEFAPPGNEGRKDNEVNRKRTAKGNAENSTTAAKDLSASNKKHRVVVMSISKRTVGSTEEEREPGRVERIRPS
ncbi:hypothetical protein B9Z19DRAFT_1121638 [Tuber borchii]|uniref:Uncharacterized protein n=1 Tax=Tuber borchii TaxID=42251 RepID=A0A2T7A2A0_TUBBO|nr:hypothetical protein B9Z19DRAFT_1121638 [Tuber borchii]